MSPKHLAKQNPANKGKLEKDVLRFLDAHKEEATTRYEALTRKGVEVYFKIREDVMKAAESMLPKEVLESNLFDFVSGEALADGSVADDSKEKGDFENFIDIDPDAVAAFENLSIPVSSTSSQNDHADMEKTTKCNYFMPSFPFVLPGFSVRTPLQQNMTFSNLPSVIRPKVNDVRERHFRAAKGNEVAFSVDGSPIVVLPNANVDHSTLLMKQIIESEEDAFSPNSREVVSMFKSLMRRKMTEAESGDHPQELD